MAGGVPSCQDTDKINEAASAGAKGPGAAGFVRDYARLPLPADLNWFWTIGAMLVAVLGLMVLTGLTLSLAYTPDAGLAFGSVEALERRLPSGWLLRAMHMTGASFCMAALYGHILRGLYYRSYLAPRGFRRVQKILKFGRVFGIDTGCKAIQHIVAFSDGAFKVGEGAQGQQWQELFVFGQGVAFFYRKQGRFEIMPAVQGRRHVGPFAAKQYTALPVCCFQRLCHALGGGPVINRGPRNVSRFSGLPMASVAVYARSRSTNSSLIASSTYTTEQALHFWPCRPKAERATPCAALARSAFLLT